MRWFFVILMALAIAVPASAHQQKVAITTIEHNPRSGLLEIVHRVPLHDAEHALRVNGDAAPDIVSDTQSRRAFARYIAQRFFVGAGGKDIALNLLGTEVAGGYLLIYQEGVSPGKGSVLAIQSQILTDIWSRQVNRVNVGAGTSPETLVFEVGDGAKQAELL